MRAAVLHGPGDLRVEDVPDPAEPRPGEVTIAVRRCGLCGTDAHEYAHGGPMTPLTAVHPWSGHRGPTIIGHEFTGVVHRSRSDLAEGTRVVAGAGRWCGSCPACVAGRTNLCVRYYTYGLNTHGGMAEYITVPAGMCVPVPDECSDADAVLAQPVAIAMHALDRAEIPSGGDVLVIGAGGIGALLVAAAADRGHAVTALDLGGDRLAAATRLGASATGLVERDAEEAPVTDVPTVFETSGSTSGLRLALSASARGGRIVAVSLPARSVDFDVRRAVVSEVDIVTSCAHVCRRDLPAAVGLLSRRSLHEETVARVLPLSRVADGLVPGAHNGKTVIDVHGEV